MRALTTNEKKVLNNISNQLSWDVNLGDIISGIIGSGTFEEGSPVNAVSASVKMVFSGDVVHGEKITIDNPLIEGSNVYEFVADEAKTVSAQGNIPVDITNYVQFASQTLTIDTQPDSGDTVTIGNITYTFVPVGTANANGEVSVGENLTDAQNNLVAAINGTDSINTPNPLVRASVFNTNVSVITALIGGSVGNQIALSSVFVTQTNTFGGGFLINGDDCSAENAITALLDCITQNDTQDVGAISSTEITGLVIFTADVAGVAGNNITITNSVENADILNGNNEPITGNSANFAGGVNGTIADETKFMFDDDYFYICLGGNKVTENNWRRISIGEAY